MKLSRLRPDRRSGLHSRSDSDSRSGSHRRSRHHGPLAALALSALPLAVLPMTAWPAELDLRIDNIKPGGELMIAIYGSAADYRKAAVKEIKVPARDNPTSVPIALGAGDYAIALYHDRNGNGKLDSNLLGVPTEPYGFSGDARERMGPATWEQAKFSVPVNGGAITVRLSD